MTLEQKIYEILNNNSIIKATIKTTKQTITIYPNISYIKIADDLECVQYDEDILN